MPAIFISHSSRDQKIADDITVAIKRLGFEEVFLDFNPDTGIGAGADWEKTLYEKLARCHALILVLTPNWLASTWCRIELSQARALGKVILPVICAPLGDRYVLPEIQAVDLVDWNSEGLARLEQRLRAIANELARGFRLDPNRPPYPGIHAFEAEDAAIYFGRDDETRAVIERLDGRRTQGGVRFLVVIGASGSGKSSLLKAGVIPQLSRRLREWLVLPPMRPERAPVTMLAKSIAQQLGKPDQWRTRGTTLSGAAAADQVQELLKELRTGEARSATVLLPVDQFEEAFTVASPTERATFLRLLGTLLDPARGLPLMVIATGRSDVLEGLLESGELAHLAEAYPLPPMPLDRLSRLVEGPAAMAGLNVEKGLSEAIARDVESPEALPLLAHALWLLYLRCREAKKLSLAEYHSLGDPARGLNPIQNSVRLLADQAIGGLKPSEAELAALRDAFVPHLVRVRLDDGRRVRQPARLADLPVDSQRLVRALVEARLLATRGTGDREQPPDGVDALVEVTHEALFQAWPRLNTWLTEEHAFLSDLERIKNAHDIWVLASEDQKAGALLGGLLLSRARDWLLKYPQRFGSRDLAALRTFIAASAEAEDAEKARSEALKQQAAEAEARRQRQELEALERDNARLKEIAAAQVNLLAQLAEAEQLRDHGDAALKLSVHAARREVDLQQGGLPPSRAAATLAVVVSRTGWRLLLSGHEAEVRSAAFSADATRIATASADKSARIWDAATGKEIAVLHGHQSCVKSAAFSPDALHVVTASYDKTARIWGAATGKEVAVLHGHEDWVNSATFSPDGKRIVTASADTTARIWDAVTAKAIAVLHGHEYSVECAAFSPDGKRIVTASVDKTARIWDAATGRPIAVLRGHEEWARSAAFSPDGSRIVTASRDKTARIWDATTAKEIVVLRGHEDDVNSAAFSPDGMRIVTSSGSGFVKDKTARIWEAATGREMAVLRGHQGPVNSAVFAPDGRHVITASYDKTARVWEAPTGKETAVLRRHEDQVNSAAFSPDGSRIVTASDDRTARVWDVVTGRETAALRGHKYSVISAAFSPDGKRIVTASYDNTARIWDAMTAKEIAVLRGHENSVRSVAFSPDGSRIVTASEDKTVRIWDATTVKEIGILRGHQDWVNAAAFSPDGSRIVTAGGSVFEKDPTARIWDATTAKEIGILRGHAAAVWSASFSPEGARIVTASIDKTARVWDAATGNEVAVLRGHDGELHSATFSPAGAHIVSASFDTTVRVWDAASTKEVAVLRGHESSVSSAAFSPDGKRIVSASRDTSARIWDIQFVTMSTKDLLVEACTRRLRGLSKLSRDDMRLAGYPDQTPEIDVCAGIE